MRSARFALPALLLLAGCSTQNETVATVGTINVTASDFEHAARGAQTQYQLPGDAAKQVLMRDLVRRAAMLELAHRLGHDQAASLLSVKGHVEERALVQALVGEVASPGQRVSEQEARALYEARKEIADVQILQALTRESALQAKKRIEAGEPFEHVAEGYSMAGQLPPDGNVGPVAPGALPAPLDGALRTQKVGELGGPYEMRDGWFLLRVKQRMPNPQGAWEALRPGMFDLMRQRKQRAAFDRAYRAIKAEYDMKLEPGASQFLFHVLSPIQPLTPSGEQLKLPLATYRGGTFTVQDAMDILNNAEAQRPPYQSQPGIEIWLEAQVMTRLYTLEAKRRHLHEEPEIADMIRAQTEQYLLEGVYQNAVASVPPPGPELEAMAWERVKSQFQRIVAVELAVLETPDSALAFRVGSQGRPGVPLADVAKATDPSLVVNRVSVRYPTDNTEWNTMLAMFTSMPEGAWFGPEPGPRGYRILQMVSRERVQQEFSELPPALQQNIRGSAAELARDQRFEAFTDSLIAAYKPVMYNDRIARLKWPAPGMR